MLGFNIDFPTAIKLRPYTTYLPKAHTVLAVQNFSVMFREGRDQWLFILSNWDCGSIWCRWVGWEEQSSSEYACQLLQPCLPFLPLKDFLFTCYVTVYLHIFLSIFVINENSGRLATSEQQLLPGQDYQRALRPEDAGEGTCRVSHKIWSIAVVLAD